MAKYIEESVRYRKYKEKLNMIKLGETRSAMAQMALAIAFPAADSQHANYMKNNLDTYTALHCTER